MSNIPLLHAVDPDYDRMGERSIDVAALTTAIVLLRDYPDEKVRLSMRSLDCSGLRIGYAGNWTG